MVDLDVCLLTDDLKHEWDNLIDRGKKTTYFQSYDWLKALEDGLGLSPRHILVRKGGGLVGGMSNFIEPIEKTPFKRLRNLPLGYDGPIVLRDRDPVLNSLFEKVDAICKKEGAVEHQIVTHLSRIGYSRPFSKAGYTPDLSTCRFVVELENMSQNRSKRRTRDIEWIREHIYGKNDFEIRKELFNRERVENFYKLYEDTSKSNGVTPFPLNFFQSMVEYLSEDNIALFTISSNEVLGGLICILDKGNKTIHPMFIGGRQGTVRELKSHIALYDYSMRWGLDQGFEHYDIGVVPADSESGLYKFKSEFGGTVYPDIRWTKEYSGIKTRLFKIARGIYLKFRV